MAPDILAKAPVLTLEMGRRRLMSSPPKPFRTVNAAVEEFLQRLRGMPARKSQPEVPSAADVALSADLAEATVAVPFESPFDAGFSTTFTIAGNSRRLHARRLCAS